MGHYTEERSLIYFLVFRVFLVCVFVFVCVRVPGERKRFVRLSEWLVVAGEERTRLPSSGTQYLKGKTGRGRAAQVRK